MCHALPVCGATLHLPSSWKSHSPLKLRHFLAGPWTLCLPELPSPTRVPFEEAGVTKGLAEGALHGTQIGALPT